MYKDVYFQHHTLDPQTGFETMTIYWEGRVLGKIEIDDAGNGTARYDAPWSSCRTHTHFYKQKSMQSIVADLRQIFEKYVTLEQS